MLFYSLVQWLKHSRKEYCELCKHRFAFTPSKYMWHLWIIHFWYIINSLKFPKKKKYYSWDHMVLFIVNFIIPERSFKFPFALSLRPFQSTPQTCPPVYPSRIFVQVYWPVLAQPSATGSITHWWPSHGSGWFLSLHVSSKHKDSNAEGNWKC